FVADEASCGRWRVEGRSAAGQAVGIAAMLPFPSHISRCEFHDDQLDVATPQNQLAYQGAPLYAFETWYRRELVDFRVSPKPPTEPAEGKMVPASEVSDTKTRSETENDHLGQSPMYFGLISPEVTFA